MKELVLRADPEAEPSCLQHLLRHRSESKQHQGLILYPFANTTSPKQVSYRTLYVHAVKNSTLIRSLGRFQDGQPILLHLGDHWDTILWFWSIVMAKGLPVLSPPLSKIDEHRHKHLQNLSSLLDSPICITSAEFLPSFDGSHTLELHTIESLLEKHGQDISSGDYESHGYFTGLGSPKDGLAYVGGRTAAFLMLTSGSTGNAKAVCLTHYQVLAAVKGKASVRPLAKDRPFLNWIGLDHVASLVEIHLAILASGGEANDIRTYAAASAILESYGAPSNVITPGFGMTETCAGAIFNLEGPEYDMNNGNSTSSLGKCMEGIDMRVTVSVAEGGTSIVLIPITFCQVTPTQAIWNFSLVATDRWDTNIWICWAAVTQSVYTLSDLAFVMLPVMIIWNLRMPLRQKIGLVLIMALSLLTMAMSIMRTVYIVSTGSAKLTAYNNPAVLTLAFLEGDMVIIMGCIPTLRAHMKLDLARFGSSISSFFKSRNKASTQGKSSDSPVSYDDLEMSATKSGVIRRNDST